jgi:pre-mRNA-splicing factor ATP-dependent RNA helicase DHX16
MVVFFELAFTTQLRFMRQVAPIQPSWLVEIAHITTKESDVEDT